MTGARISRVKLVLAAGSNVHLSEEERIIRELANRLEMAWVTNHDKNCDQDHTATECVAGRWKTITEPDQTIMGRR